MPNYAAADFKPNIFRRRWLLKNFGGSARLSARPAQVSEHKPHATKIFCHLPLATRHIVFFILESLMFRIGEIFDLWIKKRDIECICKYVESKISNDIPDEIQKTIRNKIKNLCIQFKSKWAKYHRNGERFKHKESAWLDKKISFIVPKKIENVGRPHKAYGESSARSRRRLASKLATEHNNNTDLLIHAASISARKSKNPDVRVVLNQLTVSPSRPSTICKILSSNREIISMSPEEAVVFLLENGLTVKQYKNVRDLNMSHNCNIYPSYKKVHECKLKCRPHDVKSSESCVEVSLQNLLNHTASRILAHQEDALLLTDVEEILLVSSYVFDWSTGHSLFNQNQKFENTSQNFNQSLFVTSVIPLKVISSANSIIWMNRTPQSVRFCRPLKFEFVKENEEIILREKKN